MKQMLKLTTALGFAVAVGLSSGSAALAKGHDQGFGAGTAGPGTAGMVDDTQSNRDGNGSETSYGKTDASVEAKAGTQDNSEQARDRDDPGHPSNRSSDDSSDPSNR